MATGWACSRGGEVGLICACGHGRNRGKLPDFSQDGRTLRKWGKGGRVEVAGDSAAAFVEFEARFILLSEQNKMHYNNGYGCCRLKFTAWQQHTPPHCLRWIIDFRRVRLNRCIVKGPKHVVSGVRWGESGCHNQNNRLLDMERNEAAGADGIINEQNRT